MLPVSVRVAVCCWCLVVDDHCCWSVDDRSVFGLPHCLHCLIFGFCVPRRKKRVTVTSAHLEKRMMCSASGSCVCLQSACRCCNAKDVTATRCCCLAPVCLWSSILHPSWRTDAVSVCSLTLLSYVSSRLSSSCTFAFSFGRRCGDCLCGFSPSERIRRCYDFRFRHIRLIVSVVQHFPGV